MGASQASLWSVLLPVIIGAALASVVPVALAFMHRRWALQDENRREARRVAEARRAERQRSLEEYLRARADFGTITLDFYSARRTDRDRNLVKRLEDECHSTAGKIMSSLMAAGLLWRGDDHNMLMDDAVAFEAWHRDLLAQDEPLESPRLPQPPSLPARIHDLLDA